MYFIKKASFLAYFILATISVNAQSKTDLKGVVKDANNQHPIAFASITAFPAGITTTSNNEGQFSIAVSPNTILAISAIHYYIDTLVITEKIYQNPNLLAYLKPLAANQLPDVTVKAILNSYQKDSALRRTDFLKSVGAKAIPSFSSANSGSGFAFNIDRISKREKAKRRAFAFFEKMEEEAYINYRYNALLVGEMTGLKDENLYFFMNQYRPTYQWLRQHKDTESIQYFINDQLKKYKSK